MPKFKIYKAKNMNSEVAEADFVDGKATVTGDDDQAVADISDRLSNPHIKYRAAETGDPTIDATEAVELQPGSEEHFVSVMRNIVRYGYISKEAS